MATLLLFSLGAAALGGGTYALVGAPGAPFASGEGGAPVGNNGYENWPSGDPKDGEMHAIFGPAGCVHPPNAGEAKCSWTFDAKAGDSTLFAYDRAVTDGEVVLNGAIVLDSKGLESQDEHKAPVRLVDGTNFVEVAIRADRESGLKLFIGERGPIDDPHPQPIASGKCAIEAGDPMPKTCDLAFRSPVEEGALAVDYSFGRKLAKGAALDMKEYALITINGAVAADYADFPPPAGHFVKPVKLILGENRLSVEICCMEGAGVGFAIFEKMPPPPPPVDRPIFVGGCKQWAANPDAMVCDFTFSSRSERGTMVAHEHGPAIGAVSINGQEVLPLKGPSDMKVEVALSVGENSLQIRLDPNAAGDSAVELEIWAHDQPPPPDPRPLFVGECFLDEISKEPAICLIEFKSDARVGVVVLHWKAVTDGWVSLNGKTIIDSFTEPYGELKMQLDLLDLNTGEIVIRGTGPAGIHVEVWPA